MLRKNVASQSIGFAGLSVAAGALTAGYTCSGYLVKDNGAQAALAGTFADKGNGQYTYAPSQAETNCNIGSFLFAATGMIAVEKTVVFTAADPTDAALGIGSAAVPASPTAGTYGEAAWLQTQLIGRRNTAQGGTATTITLDAAASAIDNAFLGHEIVLTGGAGSGQTATITGYVGSTKVATINRKGGTGGWSTTPDATTVFLILPRPLVNVGLWLGVAPNALQSNRVDCYVGALAGGAIAAASFAAGAINSTVAPNLDAAVSSRSTYAGGAATLAQVQTELTTRGLTSVWVGSVSTNLDATVSSRLATGGYTAPPSAATVAAAAWDLATSGHATAGTFGAAMVAAGSAGDPWSTSLPGAYGAGTAGYLVGTNLNATVSSRSTYAGGAVTLDATQSHTFGSGVAATTLQVLEAAYVQGAGNRVFPGTQASTTTETHKVGPTTVYVFTIILDSAGNAIGRTRQ